MLDGELMVFFVIGLWVLINSLVERWVIVIDLEVMVLSEILVEM
jgi:hypothetical protein